MKYMLLVYMNEQAMNDAERQQCYSDSTKLALSSAPGPIRCRLAADAHCHSDECRIREGKLIRRPLCRDARQQRLLHHRRQEPREAITIATQSPAKKGDDSSMMDSGLPERRRSGGFQPPTAPSPS